jgi:hypothetical protein
VPIPKPIDFAGPDEAALDPGAGEHFGVPPGLLQPCPEDSGGSRRRVRRFGLFHVKHPGGLGADRPDVLADTTAAARGGFGTSPCFT